MNCSGSDVGAPSHIYIDFLTVTADVGPVTLACWRKSVMTRHWYAAAPRRAALAVSLAALAAPRASAQTGVSGPGAAAAGHVVLLGDSVFDNEAYIAGGPDVVTQLRGHLPVGWRCTLAADGAVVSHVPGQLDRAMQDATHLVVSAGGNDALRQEAVFREPARNVGEALDRLAQVRDRFQRDYKAMLDAVLPRALPTAVCTIYDPRFPDPARQGLAIAGLALFNDVIVREAFARSLALIDLRLVCNEPGDLANPIEPSVQGGGKIAAAIMRLMTERCSPTGRPVIVTGSQLGG